ncbi:hypothetical protein LCGC14_1047480 [marine sediment metagenome]|uniref:Uncharacterized protein n=1 Tax=marine sediment metagenome TaxID=412755 RepID=A0A0F9QW18_9ZZZZ
MTTPAPLKDKGTIEAHGDEWIRKRYVAAAVAGLTYDVVHAPIGATRNYYLRMIKKCLPDAVQAGEKR